mgnify:CR=1 FL=1
MRHSKVGIYVKYNFSLHLIRFFYSIFSKHLSPLWFPFFAEIAFLLLQNDAIARIKKSYISHNSKRKVAFLYIFFYIKYTNTKNGKVRRYENLNYLKKKRFFKYRALLFSVVFSFTPYLVWSSTKKIKQTHFYNNIKKRVLDCTFHIHLLYTASR